MTNPQQVPLGANPPQLSALTAGATLVTLTIGGNDIGFGSVALSCLQRDLLVPDGSPCKDSYTAGGVDQLAQAVMTAGPRIGAALQGIRRAAPRAAVLLVGYPDILPEAGPGCWPVVPISSGDLPYLRGVEHQLNDMLSRQALANRAHFVDTYTSSVGHDLCRPLGVRWIEGVIPTQPAYPIHPNELGMENDARAVLAALAG
jgi:lysophospholipase L1-like esterase